MNGNKSVFICIYMLFAMCLITCNTSTNNGFKIKVKLHNTAVPYVLLYEVAPWNLKFVDSLKINENGIVQIYGNSEQNKLLALKAEGEPIFFVAKNKEEIQIDFNTKDYTTYTISNSKISNNIKKVGVQRKKLHDDFIKSSIELKKYLREANVKLGFDSISIALENRYDSIYWNYKKYLKNSLKTALKPIEILSIINHLSLEEDFYFLDKYCTQIKTEYPNSKVIKKISEKFEEHKLNVIRNAPYIDPVGLDGDLVALSDFKGKYVLLNFWFSYCWKSIKDFKYIKTAYLESKNKDLIVFNVCLDAYTKTWAKAIDSLNLSAMNHAIDIRGFDSPFLKDFDIQYIPANFLIDKNGIIINKNIRGTELIEVLSEI